MKWSADDNIDSIASMNVIFFKNPYTQQEKTVGGCLSGWLEVSRCQYGMG